MSKSNVQNLALTTSVKLPMMLMHLSTINLPDDYISDEDYFDSSVLSTESKINLHPTGQPLYKMMSKKMPTTCITPGKTIPAGYTPSGKYRIARHVPGKSDRRAGR